MATNTISSAASSIKPTFTAGGLASGLDTNSIVDGLITAMSGPLTQNSNKQAAYTIQLSSLADLTNKLNSVQTAADAMQSGASVLVASNSYSDFNITPQTGTSPGNYSIKVGTMATQAKWISDPLSGFADVTTQVKAGTLHFTTGGTTTDVTIKQGDSLESVVASINNKTGIPVTAAIINNGTSNFVTFTAKNTGFRVGQPATDALTITEDSTGVDGQAIGAQVSTAATNATFSIDGIAFESASNQVQNAIPGATLNITGANNINEGVSLSNSASQTGAKIQSLLDALNAVQGVIRPALAPAQGSDVSSSINSSSLLNLQLNIQQIMTKSVTDTGSVQSLADIGVSINQDGTFKLDQTKLQAALSSNPSGVNALFSATKGIVNKLDDLVTQVAAPVIGDFASQTKTINEQISDLKTQAAQYQAHLDQVKTRLQGQFSAMELIVSKLKNAGNFLTQEFALLTNNSSSGSSSSGG